MGDQFGFSDQIPVDAQLKAELLAFAEDCVLKAGPEALPYFRTSLSVENKIAGQGFDPVTEADRAVEASIRASIKERYPDHGIYGEEYGFEIGNGLTWVIDPIDGTRAFMSGMLHWGTLLALFDGQEPIVGVMYQPYVDELFAGDGESAWFVRGGARHPIKSSSCSDLADAVMGTTGVDWFPDRERAQFEELRKIPKLTRIGGDCYVHALVAMGSMDIGTDALLSAYDIQALIPIVRGAGGQVSLYNGESAALGGTLVCTANARLHQQVLDVINGG